MISLWIQYYEYGTNFIDFLKPNQLYIPMRKKFYYFKIVLQTFKNADKIQYRYLSYVC